MANEVANRTDMIRHFLGERPCLTHQAGDALAERIVEALDVIGEPGFLRDRFVSIRWEDHRFLLTSLISVGGSDQPYQGIDG